MSNKLWQVSLPWLFLIALATSSVRCACGASPALRCMTDSNCEAYAWYNSGCDPSDGYWECSEGGICLSICNDDCDTALDCVANDQWTEPCGGHFACEVGVCAEVCDEESCSDGSCDAAGGETTESCPIDCAQPCEIPGNCIEGNDWSASCNGHWDCQAQLCVPVCDYDSCGDGTCSPGDGETAESCPQDCLEGCALPSDCYYEQWNSICQGRWSCFQGECMEICDFGTCGNGVCDGLNGENEDSCFRDCLGGPCDALIDCLGYRWYEDCPGHWQCNPASEPSQVATGACEAICDDAGCGDGTCDTLNAETPQSCIADCSGYSCTTSPDCDVLTLPNGCTGTWICSSAICVPQCE